MNTVIIFGKDANKSSTERAISAASRAGATEIFLVRDEIDPSLPVRTISTANFGTIAAIRDGVSRASSPQVVILDARADLDDETLESFFSTALEATSGITIVPVEIEGDSAEFPESIDALLRFIASESPWPVSALIVSKSFALDNITAEAESFSEALAVLLVRALASVEDINKLPRAIALSDENAALCRLSNMTLSRCIITAINSCAVEDIFPHHAWASHRQESAAASYHALAAMLIRLGNMKAALECLSLSDQLEDSPRSLALKAIIALDRGETLGAVANMISSLQQYEARKKKESEHYLNFAPQDFEVINVNLQAGLEALNRRDNKAALEKFATAVFNFDAFYREFGLDSLEN